VHLLRNVEGWCTDDGSCTDAEKTDADRVREEEEMILAAQSAGQKALAGAEELAKGIVYTERLTTS
jgi:ATP-dependent RNA helicase DDX41